MCKYGYKTENARFGMRAAIAKQVRGDAAPRRRRKLCFLGGLLSHSARLRRYGSSSQKVLRYFLGALLVFPCSFGVACAWLRRAKPAALVYDKHTPRCQIKFPIHRLLKSCSIYELLLSLFSIEKNTCSWYNIKAHEKSVHCQHFSF